jgi:hypothetical protein
LRKYSFILSLLCVCTLTSCLTTKKLGDRKSKAIDFIDQSDPQLDVGLVYSYLQQTNDLKIIKSQEAIRSRFDELSQLDSLSTNDKSELNTLQHFWRLVEPEYIIDSSIFYNATGMDSITIQGLYCDQFVLNPNSFVTMLEELMQKSEYHKTHALLCFNFAKRNDCFDAQILSETKERFAPYYYDMLNANKAWSDVRIESLAFMLGAEMEYKKKWVKHKKKWVKQILKAQQKDGGWKGKTSDEASNSHTTILAVWLLQNAINDLER